MPANSSTEVKKRQNGVSRDKVAFGTQAQGTGLQEAYPSQTIAHTSPAPVLLQAPLGQLILEWDSGVRRRQGIEESKNGQIFHKI